MTLHAHYESYATDCDGPISRDFVLDMYDDEDEYAFQQRVLLAVVSTHTFHGGKLEVVNDDEYSLMRYVWSEATEEGGRHVEATFCTDDCDLTETSYRDYQAEAAGY